MLDERLSLAAMLYEPCSLGADIGTDHALLPCHLLEQGICDRMILADLSPKALRHAEEQVNRRHLQAHVMLRCANGFDALENDRCGCVSAMGMGGETLAEILRRGADRLQGAVLVLSAHTDPHLVRQAVQDIGYHFVREELCKAAGRFYVMWRAEPGMEMLSDNAKKYGELLYQSASPLLGEYLRWRIAVLKDKECGLLAGSRTNEAALEEVRADLAFYQDQLEGLS